MQRLWALVELVQLERSEVPLFPDPIDVAARRARRRRSSSSATTCATGATSSARTSRRSAPRSTEILIANAYFFPGVRFRRALIAAAARGVNVTLLLQARVEYRLLHYASRALYGQLLAAGVVIAEYHRSFLHAKVAVVDDRWATVGSSNIDPYSLLMAREANVFVRDPHFADQLRIELLQMIDDRHAARRARALGEPQSGSPRRSRGSPTASCGSAMGLLGYGGDEWFPRRRPAA